MACLDKYINYTHTSLQWYQAPNFIIDTRKR